jgi:uncharacterized 2Fe-2S/4Fe-4S cluster protein (DUF4445 family)
MRIFLFAFAILLGVTTGLRDAHAGGHVYLLKGLANIFSTGLDGLDEKLTKRGIKSSVHNHAEAASLAEGAARLQKAGKGPIVIVGHSLGAGAAIDMADRMKELGATVALIVTFGANGEMTVPSNVRRVINYYQGGAVATGGPGFKGSISNINLDNNTEINHLNIEKNSRLHSAVIPKIQAAVQGF